MQGRGNKLRCEECRAGAINAGRREKVEGGQLKEDAPSGQYTGLIPLVVR